MKERYISLGEVAAKLGIARGTLHYHLVHLEIERKRFPLDKRSYIRLEDFERIMRYKQEAIERSVPATDPKMPTTEAA